MRSQVYTARDHGFYCAALVQRSGKKQNVKLWTLEGCVEFNYCF